MEQKNQTAATASKKPGHFYGRFARFARLLLRTFSRRYEAKVDAPETPAVYVCRHLNMHGPYTTLKWLPFQVHPFSLNVFFSDETAIRQYREYTFSVRRGKPVRKFSLQAWITGKVTVRLLRSFQAIPVYRDSQAIRTMRQALKYLERGDSLIVWPDMRYTETYEQPCEIYSGFLYLGELYKAKTGKELPFIPLYVDDEQHCILQRPAMVVNHFQQEKEEAALRMARAIDRQEEAQ